MKKILSYIMIVSLFISLAGCEQEDVVTSFNSGTDEQNLTLTLKFEEHDSRAVKTENELNENLIQKVDLFLYPTNGTDKSAIEEKKDLKPITATNTEQGFVVNNNGTVTVKIKVSSSSISTLFPSGNECTAYAIANGPDIPENAPTSIDALKAMAITSTFDEAADATTPGDGIQDSFVMDGQGTITKTTVDGKDKLEGNIALLRAAAKITLKVSEIVTEIKEGEEVIWRPETDGMKVFFYNGVKSSKLSAEVDVAGDRYNLQFGAGIDGYGFESKIQGDNTVYNQEIPFYSYPSDWSEDQSKESYLVLLLPWRKNGAAQWTSFYYKIPISHVETVDGTTTSSSKMVRNTHYQIDVTVGILGAEENKGEVTLTPKYTLLNWGEETVDATLDKAHYLVVDKKKVEVYNQNEVKIGYKASEEISVKITQIWREDLSGNTVGTTTFYPKTTSETGATNVDAERYDTKNKYKLLKPLSVTSDNQDIKLNHDIVNTDENESINADDYKFSNDDYDFTPYHITILVTMTYSDGNGQLKTMTEEIEVIQYPAIYVEANPNSDYNTNGDDNDYHGGVYINGNRYDIDNGDYSSFGGAYHLGSATNKNPNMYVITTTVLGNGKDYVIGDPRVNSIDNNLGNTSNNWSTNARYVGGNNDQTRRLSYYYPTDNSTITKNIVAPKFRIASSYGVTMSRSYDDMRKRCASYQEDGYPAGRWRMPTKAEMEYVVSLSAEGKIPQLFNFAGDSDGAEYWCAHGVAEPQTDGTVDLQETNSGTYSVRCVYDDWYWGSDPVITTANRSPFTWGDAQR